ncbi:hypothetical protein PTKIN_Ptkin07bG0283400 [Pterospermum kingtungense]
MDFMTPKARPYNFSGDDNQKVMNVNNIINTEDKETQTATSPVSSQLLIKSSAWSSTEGLDKEVVLRRIRHHRCKSKVKSVIQAMVAGGGLGQGQEKWMELGDAFTCP